MLFFDITKRTVSRLRTCSRTVLLAGLDAAELPGSDETGCSLRDMTVPYSVPKRVTFRGNPFGYRRRHYYLRTTRSLATQHLFGNKLDPDIDQALDFTYKLDRKIFQTMITKNKEYGLAGRIRDKKRPNRSQNRQRRDTCFHLPSHHRRSFPTSNSYQIERAKTTTEAVTDSHLTIFASDTASSMSNTKDKEKKRLITYCYTKLKNAPWSRRNCPHPG